MDDAEADVLAFMTFPSEYRTKIHSTNPLERVNREIKRRTNVVGIFPNEARHRPFCRAILTKQNDEWAVARRLRDAGNRRPVGRCCRRHPAGDRRAVTQRFNLQGSTSCSTPRPWIRP